MIYFVDVKLFRKAVKRTEFRLPCAHDSYLINLASPDDVLWWKSLEPIVDELQRAAALGFVGVETIATSIDDRAGMQALVGSFRDK